MAMNLPFQSWKTVVIKHKVSIASHC
uniref:Uncharacterized protein n=1 Tax=Rhizophora mucronata TaxID=61149 RepID=A0A2P2NC46_RHIMU